MHRDVRMRGFAERQDVDKVLDLLDASIAPLPDESIPVTAATGRILAGDIHSSCDVPGFDRSAMDGYALIGKETFGATTMTPLEFRVIGETRPGHPFSGSVNSGEAVRIMTGAPIPAGCDAVLPAEKVRLEGDTVLALESLPPGKNVGKRGEDIRSGDLLLEKGRRLRPQDVGVLASVGHGEVPVIRRPTVRILITGDELLPPGATPSGAQIVDSNSLVLSGLVHRDGGVAIVPEILRDDRNLLREALSSASEDLLLVSGGSSVGSEDHAPTLVAELGRLPVHGVAMRPASPAGVGFLGERPVFLIPGNPVSCLCAYEFFAGPAVRRLGGRPMDWPHRRGVHSVARKIVSQVGRVDYVRVRIEDEQVIPIAVSGASILSSTSRADGAVIVPKESEGYGPGESVTVLYYD